MIRCCISSVILPPLPPVYRSLGVSYSSLSVVYYACGLVRFSSLHTCPSLSRSLTGNLLCFANSFISRPTTPPHPAENHITSILSYVAIVVKACITSPIRTSTSCTCGITLPYILHHHHIQYQHLCEAPIENVNFIRTEISGKSGKASDCGGISRGTRYRLRNGDYV